MIKEKKGIPLPGGKTGIEWTSREKPSLNHWYRTKDYEQDYWKIVKDYHAPQTGMTYYKIVEYYNSDILYAGKTLAQLREIMRNWTFRMVI